MNKKDKLKLEKDLNSIMKQTVESIIRRMDSIYYKGKTDRNEELKEVLKAKTILEFGKFIHKKVLRERKRPAHN